MSNRYYPIRKQQIIYSTKQYFFQHLISTLIHSGGKSQHPSLSSPEAVCNGLWRYLIGDAVASDHGAGTVVSILRLGCIQLDAGFQCLQVAQTSIALSLVRKEWPGDEAKNSGEYIRSLSLATPRGSDPTEAERCLYHATSSNMQNGKQFRPALSLISRPHPPERVFSGGCGLGTRLTSSRLATYYTHLSSHTNA